MVLLALTPHAQAGLSGRIVVDWHTGLALSGYDPVAFFTDSRALTGSAEIELRHDGVIWRFRNVGNRAAFAGRPDVYMPHYGGYDPVGIARGVAVAGNPLVWAILGERLFLFYDRRATRQVHGRAGALYRCCGPQMAGGASTRSTLDRGTEPRGTDTRLFGRRVS